MDTQAQYGCSHVAHCIEGQTTVCAKSIQKGFSTCCGEDPARLFRLRRILYLGLLIGGVLHLASNDLHASPRVHD